MKVEFEKARANEDESHVGIILNGQPASRIRRAHGGVLWSLSKEAQIALKRDAGGWMTLDGAKDAVRDAASRLEKAKQPPSKLGREASHAN